MLPYNSQKIDLVYIDPPFTTGGNFRIGEERTATISQAVMMISLFVIISSVPSIWNFFAILLRELMASHA